jgi:hypothetical protein
VQQKNLTPKLSRRINGRLQWTYPVQKVRFVVIQSFLNVRFCLKETILGGYKWLPIRS